MSLGDGALGADAIGAVEAELENLSSVSVPASLAGRYRKRLRRLFRRFGSVSLYLRGDPNDPDASANVWCAWRQTRTEELIGPIRQSDLTVLVDAQSLIDAAFPPPLKNGDMAVRFPDAAGREAVHTVIENPVLFDVGGEDVLWRVIVRGPGQ